jgi:signal transduction histidine kinase
MANSEMYWKLGPRFAPKSSFRWLGSFFHSAEVILLGLAYLVTISYNALILLDPPQIDFTLAFSPQNEAYITSVTPGGVISGRGIQIGDRIVALNGRPPVIGDHGYWAGQDAQIQTRAGTTVFVDAGMLVDGRKSWPLLLLSPWFFVFGLLVYVRCQNRSVASATQALFASIAFAMALAPASIEDHLLVTNIEFVAVTLFAPCFLRFFMVFPAYRGSWRIHAAIFVLPIIVSLLGMLALGYPPLYEVAAPLRLIVLLGYIAAGVFLILYSLIRRQSTDNGIAILGFGTIASILPFLLLYIIPMLFLRHPLLDSEYAILPLALLPMSFAYAILRHNVLNVPLIQRWLVHGTLYVGMVALYTFAIIQAVTNWFAKLLSAPFISAGIIALLVIFTVITFQWLYKRICRLLDHVFFKDSYDYYSVLQDLSRDLSTARDIDTLGVDLLRTFWELVNVEFAALLLRDQQNQKDLHLHAIVGVGHSGLSTALTKIESIIPEMSSITSLSVEDQSILAVPLRVHNFIVGYICLGPKVRGEPFRTQDRDLLNTLSAQIAAIIRNTQLVDDLRLKVNALDALTARLQHVQEEERIRMAADIHDEPLQTALHLQRQLVSTAHCDEQILPIVPLSQMLIDQLRTVCTTMRPVALDDLGLSAALDALAQEQSVRRGVPIILDIDATINDLVIPNAIELVLYRAAQEAINNCLRHAHPQTIRINLSHEDDFVKLLVVDDGQGFVVPVQLNSLVVQGHLGLIGMHERVQRIGGKLDVVSKPGRGTVVHLMIPLKRSANDSGDPSR